MFFFLQTFSRSNLARINALSQVMNVSVLSKAGNAFSFKYVKHPIFSRIPSSSFTKLTIKGLKIEKSSAPILFSDEGGETELDDDELMDTFIGETRVIANNGQYYRDIYAVGSNLTIKNCVFEDIGYHENALCFFDSNVTIENTLFLCCTGIDGILYAEKTNLILTKTNFSYNIADQNGGAINSFSSSIKIDHCMFLKNQSPYFGGAIYAEDSTFNIIKSSFLYNQAGHGSSAIEFIHTNTSIRDSYFIRNFIADIGDLEEDVVGPEDECGVAVFTDCKNVSIYRSRFVANKAGPKLDHSLMFIGNVTANLNKVVFDQVFNDTVKIKETEEGTPVVKEIGSTKSLIIPARFKKIIAEAENYIRNIIVNVGQNASTSYISFSIAIVSIVIVGVIVALSTIAGGFI